MLDYVVDFGSNTQSHKHCRCNVCDYYENVVGIFFKNFVLDY